MKTAWQITGLFFLFLIMMSITIKNKTVFNHIYGVISPVTEFGQETTENAFGYLADKTSHYSAKLFNNSVPKVKDSVKSRVAAPGRNVEPLERIPAEDKEKLDNLIKSH